ncbi:hypothetical protein V3C99_008475 [Haemonchus contortus]|uniref:Uncharacterized protein n=1 Tax=Haemonchus contortus TaxID=6289 RepID=A0A7I4Z5J9_HAECO
MWRLRPDLVSTDARNEAHPYTMCYSTKATTSRHHLTTTTPAAHASQSQTSPRSTPYNKRPIIYSQRVIPTTKKSGDRDERV